MTNLDIETFWAVVQHGTMTAAAEVLYITQPTLSMRIRALEERVGTPLFLRGKGQRRIQLTEAGQKFLTLARRWQSLLAETDSLAELGRREYLRIAATYTTNQYILPAVYRRFLSQGYPALLWIHTMRAEDSAAGLLNHELDLALIDSNVIVNEQLECTPIFREKFLMGCFPGSDFPDVVRAEDLNPNDEILITWHPEYLHWHDRVYGSGARPYVYADTLQPLHFFPRENKQLWAAVPAIAAEQLKREGLRICNFVQPPPDRVSILVTRAGEELSEYGKIFLQELGESIRGVKDVQIYL